METTIDYKLRCPRCGREQDSQVGVRPGDKGGKVVDQCMWCDLLLMVTIPEEWMPPAPPKPPRGRFASWVAAVKRVFVVEG